VKRQVAAGLVLGVLVSASVAAAASDDARLQTGDLRIAWRGSAKSNGKASSPQLHRMLSAFVPGQVIVQFRPGVPAAAQDRLATSTGGTFVGRIPELDLGVVELSPTANVLAAATRLSRRPGVAAAEPNWIREANEVIPTDPSFADQWGLRNTGQDHPIEDPPPASVLGLADADADVSDAWSVTQGSPDTVIAILDTGVDLSHSDLTASFWSNPAETAANGIDDDANGYVDDAVGFDFVGNDPTPQDDRVGHGSHVAGIAAAAVNNSIGGAGVCPACKLMVLRAGTNQGFTLAAELEAVTYAVDNGADVINMSIGAHAWSKIERDALAYAGKNSILVVAAAGNESLDNDQLSLIYGFPVAPVFPASYDLANIVSVAASNDSDQYGSFTNFGHTSTDLAAPGVDIFSTYLSGGYATFTGTSMAASFVSGVAGLVISHHPQYTPEQVRNAILNSVDKPGDLAGGLTLTSGRLNALNALTASPVRNASQTDGTMSGATPITYRKKGSLSYPTDVNDIYRKRLRAGRTYAVVLDVPRRADFDIYVWKPGATDTWPVDYGCLLSCNLQKSGTEGRAKDEHIEFTAKRTGTYYLHVTSFRGRGTYELRIGFA
jgi:subtilisin family serine protease